MKVPVACPFFGKEEAKAVYDVVKSGWLSMGRRVEEFENSFREYTNARNAIAVNNGTSALHTALIALGIKEGDEVIMPSATFISTTNVALYQGAKPVLVECDPKTYNLDPSDIESKITKKTKAIMPVDMNGMPLDYDAILEIAEKHSIPVIADSAESLGATYKNKRVGSICPVHCFSFFPNKNITTGEGGMITTSDEGLAERMRVIRNQGQDRRYHHVVLGHNYRMTELQAAVGIEQLKRIEWVLKEKDGIAKAYTDSFAGAKNIEPPFVPDYVTRHAWYMYTVSVKNSNRDGVVKVLNEKGIETRLSFPPIHTQPLYKNLYGFTDEFLPVTYSAWKSLINIPIWAGMKREAREYVIKTLIEVCKR